LAKRRRKKKGHKNHEHHQEKKERKESNEPISKEVCSKKRQSAKSSTSENPVPRMMEFCAAGFRFLAKKYVITDAAPTTPEITKGSQSAA